MLEFGVLVCCSDECRGYISGALDVSPLSVFMGVLSLAYFLSVWFLCTPPRLFFNLCWQLCVNHSIVDLFLLVLFSCVHSYLFVDVITATSLLSVPRSCSSAIWLGTSLCKHSFSQVSNAFCTFTIQLSLYHCSVCVCVCVPPLVVAALEQLNWD